MDKIYLDKTKIQYLSQVREKIVEQARQALAHTGIDILANDTLNALSMYQIVSHYDQDYDVNFHRNGEDARSGNVIIEQKCSTGKLSKTKHTVGKTDWKFHAQGELLYPRYIFALRRRDTLTMVRLYDVASQPAVQTVQQNLLAQRQAWIDAGKPNWDGIKVQETLLLTLPPLEILDILGCRVVKL